VCGGGFFGGGFFGRGALLMGWGHFRLTLTETAVNSRPPKLLLTRQKKGTAAVRSPLPCSCPFLKEVLK
jgi:hypothetical protein